jgi:hypothetical protein
LDQDKYIFEGTIDIEVENNVGNEGRERELFG